MPPVGVVYQLNAAFGVDDDALKVAVCPASTDCVGGVTVILGGVPPDGFTVTLPPALIGEVTPVTGSFASA